MGRPRGPTGAASTLTLTFPGPCYHRKQSWLPRSSEPCHPTAWLSVRYGIGFGSQPETQTDRCHLVSGAEEGYQSHICHFPG